MPVERRGQMKAKGGNASGFFFGAVNADARDLP